ncbi:hypothetical protein ACTL6P_07935 [Endozoicomonas acroporae]|nr:hypothetical protein [Endozoicomonas acroporae]
MKTTTAANARKYQPVRQPAKNSPSFTAFLLYKGISGCFPD